MEKNHHRLVGLEIIRFSMAAVVLVYHFKHFAMVDTGGREPDTGGLPFHSLLWPIYEYGVTAVHVFWALSGFIFFEIYASRIATAKVSLGEFAVMRFSRLYPLHFATLILADALQYVFRRIHGDFFVYQSNDAKHFVLHLLFASDWLKGLGNSFNGPVWSVSVEVLVYAVFFALVRLLGGSIWVAGAATLVGLVGSRGEHQFSPVLLCTFYFFFGGVIQHLFRSAAPLRRRLAGVWNPLIAAFLIALIFATSWVPRLQNPSIKAILILPPVMFIALDLGQRISGRMERVIVGLGNLTYASYLIHFPLQLLIAIGFIELTGSTAALQRAWLLPLFVLSTLALSRAVFVFFELPMQQWLRTKLAPQSLYRQKEPTCSSVVSQDLRVDAPPAGNNNVSG